MPGLENYRWMGLDNEQRGRVALLRGRGSRPAVVEKSDSGGLSPILERCSFACDGLRRVRRADHPASAWSARRTLRAPVTISRPIALGISLPAGLSLERVLRANPDTSIGSPRADLEEEYQCPGRSTARTAGGHRAGWVPCGS